MRRPFAAIAAVTTVAGISVPLTLMPAAPALASACTISEDASTPAVATSLGNTTGVITSASFSPPAGSMLVANLVTTFRSTGNAAETVKDSTGATWTAGPARNDGDDEFAGIYYRYVATAPGAITVTATDTNHAQAGYQLAVRVDTGASSTPGASVAYNSTTGTSTLTHAITTTAAGSWVYADAGLSQNGTATANSATSTIKSTGDSTENSSLLTGRKASATGTPGAVTLGWTSTASGQFAWSALEIVPASTCGGGGGGGGGGTCAITRDASTPVATAVTGNTTGTVTSASFTPPAGSLVEVAANAGFASHPNTPVLSVSDSASGAWTAGPHTTDGVFDGTSMWQQYETTSPGAITVTVTDTDHAAAGYQLDIVVLDGAAASQAGAASASRAYTTGTTTASSSITTTAAGSYVAVADAFGNVGTGTPNSATTTVTDSRDSADVTEQFWGKQANLTGTPGPVTLGWTDSASQVNTWAAQEVLPAQTCGGSGGGGGGGPAPSWNPNGTYTSTFDDEFSGTSVNTAVWEEGWFLGNGNTGTSGPVNSGEAACYNSSNLSESGGFLNLALAHTASSCPGGSKPWTGSLADTRNTFTQYGGSFEARACLAGSGSSVYGWPAWWADGINGTWPAFGEIDMAEGLSGPVDAHLHSAAQNGPGSPDYNGVGCHTYGVSWDTSAGTAKFYYDGALFWSNAFTTNGSPMYLILDNTTNGTDNPQNDTMTVDWVRAWSQP